MVIQIKNLTCIRTLKRQVFVVSFLATSYFRLVIPVELYLRHILILDMPEQNIKAKFHPLSVGSNLAIGDMNLLFSQK